MNQGQPIFYAILGAILAGISQLIAGLVIDLVKNRRQSSAAQINFKLVVRTELESVAKQLEKLKTSLNERSYYPFASITSLRSRVARLEPNIAEIYKAGKESSDQTEFVTTVTDLGDLVQDIDQLETYMLNERNSYNSRLAELGNATTPVAAIKPDAAQTADKPIEASVSEEKTQAKIKYDEATRFTETQRNARLVELVDIKRRCEALIEKLRD